MITPALQTAFTGTTADARLDLLEQQQVFTASAEVVSAADRSPGALIDTRT